MIWGIEHGGDRNDASVDIKNVIQIVLRDIKREATYNIGECDPHRDVER